MGCVHAPMIRVATLLSLLPLTTNGWRMHTPCLDVESDNGESWSTSFISSVLFMCLEGIS